MTSQDTEALKALVALAKKAGAHEWAIDGDDRPGMEWNNFIVQADARHMTVCFMAHAEGDNSELEAAAEFIAAAKNAIPALERMLASQLNKPEAEALLSQEPSSGAVGELMIRDGIVSFHTLVPIEQLHEGPLFASPVTDGEK